MAHLVFRKKRDTFEMSSTGHRRTLSKAIRCFHMKIDITGQKHFSRGFLFIFIFYLTLPKKIYN